MTGLSHLDHWTLEATRRHGDKFDLTDVMSVHPGIRAHFHGARIEVTRDGWTRRGRVSVTTGWKPALLLMHRRSDRSSADVLDERDQLVRVVSP